MPVGEMCFKTKQNLVYDIIKHQVSAGISFDQAGADRLNGNDAAFAEFVDSMGLIYLLDDFRKTNL